MINNYEFSFKLEAAPPAGQYIINYPQQDGFSLEVTYDKKSYDMSPSYKINSITINRILAPDTNVLSAPPGPHARQQVSSKSLQINYYHIIMSGNCKKPWGNIVPEISIGQTAYLTVKGLVDNGSTILTIESCKLIIGAQTYTVTPTRYVDNRITNADCEIIASGGHRRKRRATKKAGRNMRRKTKKAKNIRRQRGGA